MSKHFMGTKIGETPASFMNLMEEDNGGTGILGYAS